MSLEKMLYFLYEVHHNSLGTNLQNGESVTKGSNPAEIPNQNSYSKIMFNGLERNMLADKGKVLLLLL